MNVLEQELHEMIAAIVGNTDFGITTVLGYAGLTSISAIKLAVQVNKRFGVALDSKSLVKTGSLQSIENEILTAMMSGNAKSAQPVSATVNVEVKSAPLTYAQTGVYVECLKDPASTVYNIPYLLTYPSAVEAEKLAAAVKAVVERHPELSVHFTTEGDQIVQTLEGRVPVEVTFGVEVEERGVYGATDDEHLADGKAGLGGALHRGTARIHDERTHSATGTAQELEGDDAVLAATDWDKVFIRVLNNMESVGFAA
jgi:hypothetical protein